MTQNSFPLSTDAVAALDAGYSHVSRQLGRLADALAELHLAVTMRPSGCGCGLSRAERIALDRARSLLAEVQS